MEVIDQHTRFGRLGDYLRAGDFAGLLRRFDPDGKFRNPEDFGTLEQGLDGSYLYTAKDQTRTYFYANGLQERVVDVHVANLRRLRAMLAFDGESVHHVFLHAFLCFPDAQYVLSLFSTGVQCFTKIFSVVV